MLLNEKIKYLTLLPLGPNEDDVDRPAVQARSTNANTPTVPAQAMKIILEEDENSDSPPAEYELN